ncbi:MAG: membrane protein insertase YidC [Methylococcales bacterium]|nr:membrane protein insertase YidC [Methylococcales bacterium]
MDNIRFLLVIAFAMISYMLWEQWQLDYGPKPEIATLEQPTILEPGADLPTTGNVQAGSSTQNLEAVPVLEVPADKIITVKTDVFTLEIDTNGGTVRNLDLVQYPYEKENTVVNSMYALIGMDPAEKDLSPVRLFDSSGEKQFLAQSGLIASSGSAKAPDHHASFTAKNVNYELVEGQDTLTIPLEWTNNEGVVFTKTYTLTRGSYDISVVQKVSNDSAKAWTGRQYSQLLRVPYEDDKGNTFIRTYAGGVVYTAEEKYQKVTFEDMAEENLSVTTLGGWSAMTQHYFATAWVPPADQENHFYTKELKDWRYVIGSYSPAVTVAPHTDAIFSSHLFAGPKIQPMMEKVATGLELTVDYGWLTIIGKPIYWLLNQIHDYIGNWGVSILGVTMCIKLLFFKLSQASFRSMAKMRKIQPKLKDLQEKFKDDRQRFNTEMMAMYKKEKVNPMGGCLPIMVQIPVFISLYWVLIETVELRQADFVLWIQDLSAQDPYFILPVIMGITMKIQQSLNPAPLDPLQAKVMKMFPIIFTVFFLFFPAGLVFYWVCNNTLSICQQWYITKQIEADNS